MDGLFVVSLLIAVSVLFHDFCCEVNVSKYSKYRLLPRPVCGQSGRTIRRRTKKIAFGTVSALAFTYFDGVVFFMIDSFELQFIVLVSFVYGKRQRPVFQLPFVKAAGEPLSVSLLRLSVTLGEKGDETVAVFLCDVAITAAGRGDASSVERNGKIGCAERMPAHAKKFVGIAGTHLAISNPKGITIKVYAGFFLI